MTRVVWLVCSIICTSGPACCQGSSEAAFEVATIRISPQPDGGSVRYGASGGPGTSDPSIYTCSRCSLTGFLLEAYGVRIFQLLMPDWSKSMVLDVSAKVPEGATREQFPTMLRRLLEDRLKVAAHREVKEVTLYVLTVPKTGPKFKESALSKTAVPASPGAELDVNGFPIVPDGRTSMGGIFNGVIRMTYRKETMADLTEALARMLNSPVTDATGLKGEYDFKMFWSRRMESAASSGDSAPTDTEAAPTLIGAVESQLGLKMVRKKGPVEMLVIDHVEKVPVEN